MRQAFGDQGVADQLLVEGITQDLFEGFAGMAFAVVVGEFDQGEPGLARGLERLRALRELITQQSQAVSGQ